MEKSIKIPFLLKIVLTKHYGLQGSLEIKLLIFSFYIGLYYGLGWAIYPTIDKWSIRLSIYLKRVFINFTVGIPLYSILCWKINRLRKKMSPEKKKNLKR